jgi:5-exo-hydroxycamphor dehydrogenase
MSSIATGTRLLEFTHLNLPQKKSSSPQQSVAKMRRGKVAIFTKCGQPIQIVEEESPDPASDQILVRMVMAGICGSDAHRVKGDIAAPARPICFGHEAVGVIEALGSEVQTDRMGTPLAVGDMLYWLPSTPCGTCWECSISNPLRCKDLNWPVPAGGPNAAGFREYATIGKRCTFIRVPPDTSPESVIVFGCAMPTALRGFSKLGNISNQTDVVIQGSGPLGLASTLLASLAGARTVTVIGDPDSRLEVATRLGATKTFSVANTTLEQRRESILELTQRRGAGIVVEAAGAAPAFPEGFNLLDANGKYLILGLYSGQAATTIDPIRINNLNLAIIGSLGIEVEGYHRTVEIASEYDRQYQLAELVTHRFSLERLEYALELVAKGVPVKAVIVP